MKLTYDGFTMEGTPEEIKEMMTAMGAEFPESAKTKEAEETLKVGDIAVIERADYGCMGGFSVGDKVIIVENPYGEDDCDYRITKVGAQLRGYAPKEGGYLRKIVIEDVPTFREGDRVKALADGEFRDVKAGEVGEITDTDAAKGVESDPYTIRVDTEDDIDYFRPQDLELVTEEDEEETVEFNGRKYRNLGTVEAKDGDLVRFKRHWIRTTAGKLYEVIDGIRYEDDGGYTHLSIDGWGGKGQREVFRLVEDASAYGRAPENAKVYAPVVYKPTEGDIVVITANTNLSRNKVGDIGKVSKLSSYGTATVDVPDRPGGPTANGNWTKFSEMRPATEGEKAQYEKALKFAKLDRKPGEFKKGDIVRLTEFREGHSKGTIAEVGDYTDSDEDCVYIHTEEKRSAAMIDYLELIAPVESRVDV